MDEKIEEIKKMINRLPELELKEREAYDEYLKDVEENKEEFMMESLICVQNQVTDDIKNNKTGYEEGEIDDRIDDVFNDKCKSLKSFEKFTKIKREIALINRMKAMKRA